MGVALAILIGLVVIIALTVAMPPIGIAALIALVIIGIIVFATAKRGSGSTGQSGQTR